MNGNIIYPDSIIFLAKRTRKKNDSIRRELAIYFGSIFLLKAIGIIEEYRINEAIPLILERRAEQQIIKTTVFWNNIVPFSWLFEIK